MNELKYGLVFWEVKMVEKVCEKEEECEKYGLDYVFQKFYGKKVKWEFVELYEFLEFIYLCFIKFFVERIMFVIIDFIVIIFLYVFIWVIGFYNRYI